MNARDIYHREADFLSQKPRLGEKFAWAVLDREKPAANDCRVREKSEVKVRCTSGKLFPGQYFDQETGLHYNYYRDYDPSTGRYIESDPIGLGGGLNTFAYVSNSPLMKVDFFGLDDSFTCRCTATGAGIDNTATLKKECSYSCKCSVSSCDGGNQKNVNVNVSRVETSARSGQSWDRGSQICHGQYGYRPRLDDPNWKVKTMFSEFTINQNGEVTYDPGRVEVSNRTYSYFPRTPTATEVSSVIKSELNKQ